MPFAICQSKDGVHVFDVEGIFFAASFDDPQDARAAHKSIVDVDTFFEKYGDAFVFANFVNNTILVTNRIDFDTAGKAAKVRVHNFSTQQATQSALDFLEQYTKMEKELMGKEM